MAAYGRVCFDVGDTVRLSRERVGIVQYIGSIHNKYGEWYGIELKNTLNGGKHNGSKKGIFYFRTQNNRQTGIFVRLHQIQYLIKRNQKKKTKIIHKKSKINQRNYIKTIKQTMSLHLSKKPAELFSFIPECTLSLIDIPKDVLQYNLFIYLHSFERFKLRRVCTEFNHIFMDTQHILACSITADITYWTQHALSKYYKISPNYFTHLDLTYNRLSYLSQEERTALKYFAIYNRNIENLLDTKQECKQQDTIQTVQKVSSSKANENAIEMTRISFFHSSVDTCTTNVEWICDVLTHYRSANITNHINCLKILDLNYIGLTDEHLLRLCEALLARKNALSELEYLLLLNNIHITDQYIELLFQTIEKRCCNLLHLNLRRCNLSDASCSVISNFYVRNHERTSIKHLDLELNTKITKIGNDKINKIFQIKNKKLFKELIIHYGANKKSYCWQCRTLYDQ